LRSQLAVAAGARLIYNNRAQLAISGGIAANEECSVDIDPTQNLEALSEWLSAFAAEPLRRDISP
jgi:hypothetical protein